MEIYFSSKLADINYRISVHEGNANQRLASEALKISLLPSYEVPDEFKIDYEKLLKLIKETLKSSQGRIPTRLLSIQNRTAIKYIELLINIGTYIKK
ncbi:MAG: hypothetical protein GY714_10900 [Desulfobacterales bacterium]|nr:hypothetical protein [Desulfobacterales bacterium]